MAWPDWYSAWRDEAFVQLQAKTARMLGTYGIGGPGRFDFSVDAGTLIFSDRGVRQVVADAQVVGTISHSENNWLWGWANDSFPASAVADLHRVRSFGLEHGIEELTSEYLEGEDLHALGWALTAVATRIVDAQGAYRPGARPDVEAFLILNSVRRVS